MVAPRRIKGREVEMLTTGSDFGPAAKQTGGQGYSEDTEPVEWVLDMDGAVRALVD